MKNIDFKKLLPYVTGIVIFIVITFLYFSPLLEGKKLLQSDIVNFQGVAKEVMDFRKETGKEPLWTNSMFGGMPAYQVSAYYSGNILGYLDKIFTLGLPHPANLVFLYMAGFFFLLLVLRVNPWLSIAGAIAFGFSSFFFVIIDVGHNSQAQAIGYMAPVLAGIILTFRRNYMWGGIITALFLSLELKANHPQISYYLMMIGVILGIAELIDAILKKTFPSYLKSIGIIAVACILAVFSNITSLWATYEYGKYTIRGKSELTSEKENRTSGLDKTYATQWSYGVGETMTLLIPNFYGGSSNMKINENSKIVDAMKANSLPEGTIKQFTDNAMPFMYWGTQPFTMGPVYVGAIIFFLFIFGLIIVKGPVKWGLLAATLISIMLAWGHNFMGFTDFFMNYIPGYNKFRAVSMTLVIAEFTMPLLALLALKEVYDNKDDPKRIFKGLKISLIIVGIVTLIFALLPDMFLDFIGPTDKDIQKNYQFPDWFMQAIRDERLNLVRKDSIRALVFILLSAGLVWAVLYRKIKSQYASLAIIFLIIIDMFMVDKRYVTNDGFTTKSKVENPIEPTPANERILQDKSLDYRVLNLTLDPFRDASTSYFHKSIGGYHGAKLRRYQELYDEHISQQNLEVLNMLNTKYFIVPDNNRNPVAQINPSALGNAWFVQGYKMVENADQEIKALTKFNPKDTAIVSKEFKDQLTSFTPNRDSSDFIRLDEYKANHLKYSYKSKNAGLAVFSEIYYPKGWNATVDGNPAPHFRVNYVLRAMVLPAGEHKVEFDFHPKVYFIGEQISRASSILLLLLIMIFGALEIRKTMYPKA